ncbi:Xaa-Pro aminopeptidase [Campylobacter sp. MIT 12-5580]|uniref:aminopeptidase P family protein n=1 Tax=Campylobacter sp. MIT 12-5580 TaxID=2040651 RepID=UPI0010F6F10B|nr:aminopeptidase P family protein [Campylobacter sp. MIT 12-5580]TKX28675.1 Xaa-Pro aminopeptidase [Campylobacter sp. MIT 12-5580]
MSIYASRIKALQTSMKKEKISAFVVLSSDIHFNEYLPACAKQRAFLSGFTGSAGTLVVLENEALLFADGRYHLQALKELEGSGIRLEKLSPTNSYISYLSKHLKQSCVAVDSKSLSVSACKEFKKSLKAQKNKLIFKDLSEPLFVPKPPLPRKEIYEQKKAFISASRSEKLAQIRAKMKELNASYHLISSLDDIAYITNLRGKDIECNPVFLSFLCIGKKEAVLFASLKSIDMKLKAKLLKEGFELKEYEELINTIKTLPKSHILIDPLKTSVFIARALKKQGLKLVKAPNPSTLLKACKNDKEIQNIKNAMISDGVALCEFFAWLEKALKQKQELSELDINDQITAFRAKNPLFISNSFSVIAGFNENGALPHYRATKESFSKIKGNGLLLIDSGAQYENGTTDITRVVPIHQISREQKKDYTLVLKALIAMSRAVFPKNIALPLLDSIARLNLWQNHLDYMHGTGHGVGYFLNVHEGPAVLSVYAPLNAHNIALKGVFHSIEPGIYKANKHGVRLENLVVIKEEHKNEFGEFMSYETLTLCPFEKTCIELKMLDESEKKWLNDYHKLVFKKLSVKLKGEALAWLKRKTKAL